MKHMKVENFQALMSFMFLLSNKFKK